MNFIRSHRAFLTLIGAQAVCLAFALWAQDRFVAAHQKYLDSQLEAAAALASSDVEETATGAVLSAEDVAAEQYVVRVLGFVWITALQAVVAWLIISRLRGDQEKRQLQSEEEVMLKSKELLMTRDAIVFGLAKLAESRDPDTGMHLE
ncbi:MAG: hypothetical protein R3B90_23700, partial [Planctomycetaceae bacterium]